FGVGGGPAWADEDAGGEPRAMASRAREGRTPVRMKDSGNDGGVATNPLSLLGPVKGAGVEQPLGRGEPGGNVRAPPGLCRDLTPSKRPAATGGFAAPQRLR